MTTAIFDLAMVVLIGAVFGVIAKVLRQPTILAYLATGILIGALGFISVGDSETFVVFSELGVMLLLFLVGMEIDYASFRLVGRVSLVVGLTQMVATFGAGYGLAHWFGFALLPSIYIALALSFSSTIIVVKLLSDKRDLNSLYGKISIGMLLLQDLVAIIVLVVLSGIQRGQGVSLGAVILTIFEAAVLFTIMLFLGRKVLPWVLNHVAQSHELLFLVSLAWVFAIAAAVSRIGFSVEIAGFLAGIALANSSEHHQIAQRIKPLRDFFLIAFFVLLGARAVFSNLSDLVVPIIALSLFVLVVKPLFVLITMGILGYRRRTSFMTSVTIAQVSEFSLVLLALGNAVGHVGSNALALMTAVSVITIVASSYMIQFSDPLFRRVRKMLSFFEHEKSAEQSHVGEGMQFPIVLIGFHRVGESIAMGLPKDKLLVVEFDPEKVKKLKREGYHHVFGDISDPEIYSSPYLADASLIISTSPNFEDSRALIAAFRSRAPRPKIVVRSEAEGEAEILYREGADYVLFPHLTSGQYFGKTIAIDPEMKILEQLKAKDLSLLRNFRSYAEVL